jgi:hypothetical protein
MTIEMNFPYPVSPPYRDGWQDELTKKHGRRGREWTTTPSQPQWTLHFKKESVATWFKLACGER